MFSTIILLYIYINWSINYHYSLSDFILCKTIFALFYKCKTETIKLINLSIKILIKILITASIRTFNCYLVPIKTGLTYYYVDAKGSFSPWWQM